MIFDGLPEVTVATFYLSLSLSLPLCSLHHRSLAVVVSCFHAHSISQIVWNSIAHRWNLSHLCAINSTECTGDMHTVIIDWWNERPHWRLQMRWKVHFTVSFIMHTNSIRQSIFLLYSSRGVKTMRLYHLAHTTGHLSSHSCRIVRRHNIAHLRLISIYRARHIESTKSVLQCCRRNAITFTRSIARSLRSGSNREKWSREWI